MSEMCSQANDCAIIFFSYDLMASHNEQYEVNQKRGLHASFYCFRSCTPFRTQNLNSQGHCTSSRVSKYNKMVSSVPSSAATKPR